MKISFLPWKNFFQVFDECGGKHPCNKTKTSSWFFPQRNVSEKNCKYLFTSKVAYSDNTYLKIKLYTPKKNHVDRNLLLNPSAIAVKACIGSSNKLWFISGRKQFSRKCHKNGEERKQSMKKKINFDQRGGQGTSLFSCFNPSAGNLKKTWSESIQREIYNYST